MHVYNRKMILSVKLYQNFIGVLGVGSMHDRRGLLADITGECWHA